MNRGGVCTGTERGVKWPHSQGAREVTDENTRTDVRSDLIAHRLDRVVRCSDEDHV
jgi:hypothetical protein